MSVCLSCQLARTWKTPPTMGMVTFFICHRGDSLAYTMVIESLPAARQRAGACDCQLTATVLC
jgi:hypothetical protein